MNEYDHEPVRGLPAELPPGETMLWQGSPDWRCMARRAFHMVPVAGYFALLTVATMVGRPADESAIDGALAVAQVAGLGVTALAILGVLAWLTARSTVYTVTTKRVVIRFGVALQISLNLPFRMIDGAGLRLNPDGSGDIPLQLRGGEKLAYLMLWPHARPWRFSPAQPMLRAIPQAGQVAQILGRALAVAASQSATVIEPPATAGALPQREAVVL